MGLYRLLLGQFAALCCSGATLGIDFMYLHDVHLSLSAIGAVYLTVCIGITIYRFIEPGCPISSKDKLFSLIVGAFDVGGNAFMMYGFKFSNQTSLALFSSGATIPITMITSHLFLGYRYELCHHIAVVMAAAGYAVITLWQEEEVQVGQGANFGNLMFVISGCFFALSQSGSEYLMSVKKTDSWNMMKYQMFGATLVCAFFIYLFDEVQQIPALLNNRTALYGFLAFVGLLDALYVFIPRIITHCGVCFFNLSLLCCAGYNSLFEIFIFDKTFHHMYVIGSAVIVASLVLFYWTDPKVPESEGVPLIADEEKPYGA